MPSTTTSVPPQQAVMSADRLTLPMERATMAIEYAATTMEQATTVAVSPSGA
jgi:hypothetical protein